MNMKKLVVVGDRFFNFTETENVISATTAERMIGDTKTPGNVRLHLGQGVSLGRVERLISIAKQHQKAWMLAFSHIKKAGSKLVHKHNPRNSLLGIPERINQNLYSVDVYLNDECAEMSDHLTGQHIQGMVLVEAARQAFLAITEVFYLKDNAPSSYFVINKMDTEYKRFVFPVAIRISYEVVEHVPGKNGSHRFKVMMSLMQNDQVCCIVKVEFSTYDAAFIKTKEKTLAHEAVTQELFPEMASQLAS
jgi:A-factor biosynthesis hotdog domain